MGSELANFAITSDEKEQTGWFDLPYEMRSMIIELMDTKTRGKLSCCSKLCCQEVRRSKNYIDYIAVEDGFLGMIKLIIHYQNYSSHMVFTRIGNTQCLITYQSPFLSDYPEQKKIVDGSVNDIVFEKFDILINDAIHLNRIVIDSERLRLDKTSIAHMKKLRRIRVTSNRLDVLKCGFLKIDQLISASQHVFIDSTNIEIDQLINLKAERIILRHVVFSPAQLKQYFAAWNNNQIHGNVKKVIIECSNGRSLSSIAGDIVSGLDVITRKRRNGLKYWDIKNSAGKLARIRIRKSFILYFGELDDEDSTDDDDDSFDYGNYHIDDYNDLFSRNGRVNLH